MALTTQEKAKFEKVILEGQMKYVVRESAKDLYVAASNKDRALVLGFAIAQYINVMKGEVTSSPADALDSWLDLTDWTVSVLDYDVVVTPTGGEKTSIQNKLIEKADIVIASERDEWGNLLI
jgi:hypothetical protein